MIQRLSAVEARLTESAGAMQVLCKGGLRQPGRAEAAGLQRAGDAGAQGIAGDAVREVEGRKRRGTEGLLLKRKGTFSVRRGRHCEASDRPAVRGWWERGVQGGAKLPPPTGGREAAGAGAFGRANKPGGTPAHRRWVGAQQGESEASPAHWGIGKKKGNARWALPGGVGICRKRVSICRRCRKSRSRRSGYCNSRCWRNWRRRGFAGRWGARRTRRRRFPQTPRRAARSRSRRRG